MINSVNNSSLVNASLHSATNPLTTEEMFNKHSIKPDSENFNSNEAVSNDNVQVGDFGVDKSPVIGNQPASDLALLGAKSKDEESDGEDLGVFGQDENDDQQDVLSYDGKASAVTLSFESLAAEMGAGSTKVTKGQLFAFLQSLLTDDSQSADTSKEIAFVKKLISKFDTIAEGENYITSFASADVVLNSLLGNSASPDDGVISTFELRA